MTGGRVPIEAAGGDPDEVVRPLGFDRTRLADPHGFIPSADFARILEAAACATGDDCFGLHFGEHFHPKDIGALVFVVLNSPTLAVGFSTCASTRAAHPQRPS